MKKSIVYALWIALIGMISPKIWAFHRIPTIYITTADHSAIASRDEWKEVEKPRDFDPFGQTGLSPLATI